MYTKWRGIFGTLTLAAALSVLGCGTSNNAYVRTVNASPGLTDYTVQVGVTGVASSLPYGTEGVQQPGQYSTTDTSGNYRIVGAGTAQAIVIYQKPGTNLATTTATLAKGSYYTIVNANTFPGISVLALTDNTTAPTSGNYKLRVVQSSASAGAVNVYLTSPGATPSGSTPTVSNLQFGQVTQNYLELGPGSYEVQVTRAGNPGTVLAKLAFTPTAGNIYTVFPLDPAPGSTAFGVLVTTDAVASTNGQVTVP
ncbi:MAG: DUF4397 domain-containing protein [Acidobacteriaceae bacterium]